MLLIIVNYSKSGNTRRYKKSLKRLYRGLKRRFLGVFRGLREIPLKGPKKA